MYLTSEDPVLETGVSRQFLWLGCEPRLRKRMANVLFNDKAEARVRSWSRRSRNAVEPAAVAEVRGHLAGKADD